MEKGLIGSLPQWVEDYDNSTEIRTMQEFFLYCTKKWANERQVGYFLKDGSIEYLTRKQVNKLALHVGSFLLSRGLQKGDRVGVYTENRLESAVFLEACHLFGFVAVFAFDPSTDYYPRFTLVNAEVTCIYISPRKSGYFPILFKGDFCDSLKFIIMNEPRDGAPCETVLFDSIKDFPIVESLPNVEPDDPCTFIYSSGTCGAPKGVVISNEAMVAGVIYIKVSVPVKYHDVHVSFLPMAHILERIGYLIFTLRGAAVVFASNGTIDIIKDYRAAHVTGGPIIPSILSRIHESIMNKFDTPAKKMLFNTCINLAGFCRKIGFRSRIADALLFNKIKNGLGGSIDWFACAGDVFDKTVHDNLSLMLSADILAIYGLSECTGPLFICPANEFKSGTVGRPMPYVQTKFGPKNEIMIKTPALFTEYWKNPEVTRNSFVDGWFNTGDKGVIDPETRHLIVPGRAYETYEYKSGVELALPFIRFTYNKYILCKDIILKPIPKFNCLVAVVVVDKKVGVHFSKNKDLTDEEFEELLKDQKFITYIHSWMNEYAREVRLNEGAKLHAVRLTSEGFTKENGLVTATGKLRVNSIYEKYDKEFKEMEQQLEKEINEEE